MPWSKGGWRHLGKWRHVGWAAEISIRRFHWEYALPNPTCYMKERILYRLQATNNLP